MKQYFSSDFNCLPSNFKLLDSFSFFPLHQCVFLFCKAPIPVGGAPMWKEFYSVLKELFSESSCMPREFSIFTVKHNEIFFYNEKVGKYIWCFGPQKRVIYFFEALEILSSFRSALQGNSTPNLSLTVTMPLDAKCWHAEIYDCNFS